MNTISWVGTSTYHLLPFNFPNAKFLPIIHVHFLNLKSTNFLTPTEPWKKVLSHFSQPLKWWKGFPVLQPSSEISTYKKKVFLINFHDEQIFRLFFEFDFIKMLAGSYYKMQILFIGFICYFWLLLYRQELFALFCVTFSFHTKLSFFRCFQFNGKLLYLFGEKFSITLLFPFQLRANDFSFLFLSWRQRRKLSSSVNRHCT